MAARKIAISLPEGLLEEVDAIALERGESRSGCIATVLHIFTSARSDAAIRRKINALFADPEMREEQLRVPRLMKHNRSTRGTEW